MCERYKPQIAAVQECQLRGHKVINLNGFFGITKSAIEDNSTGRVSIYIKTNLVCLVKLNQRLICRLSLSVSAKKTLTVCNVYLPPSQDVNLSDLEHLVPQLPAPFVLTGDFNVHSPLWDDIRHVSRSQMLEKSYHNLCLLNACEPTCRHPSHHPFSVPDISVCDPPLPLEID